MSLYFCVFLDSWSIVHYIPITTLCSAFRSLSLPSQFLYQLHIVFLRFSVLQYLWPNAKQSLTPRPLILARIVLLEAPALRLLGFVALLHDDLLLRIVNGQTFVRWAVPQLFRARIVRPQLDESMDNGVRLIKRVTKHTHEYAIWRQTWLPLDPWHPYSTTSPPE